MSVSIVLSFLAGVSAFLFLRANQWGPKRQEYLFKPLTTILILLIALLAPVPENALYKWAIVIGLAFSLAGDIFLLLPRNRFIFGLVAFLIAHIFFTLAFTTEGFYLSLLALIPFAIFGGLVIGLLWPVLGKLRLPASLYALVLMIMGWQAAGYWITIGSQSSILAFVGAVLFIISDSIMIFHRFRSPHRYARLTYMTLYYLALWLIAMSVVVY
ncbi:MAG: lysoplasmalogenase [Anaerolineae bacterium]|nr:MAG: lysoplasmalogenase [Anaerolineae bacterium]